MTERAVGVMLPRDLPAHLFRTYAQRAETLGLKLANRTASFLDRRNTLHGKLFPASR